MANGANTRSSASGPNGQRNSVPLNPNTTTTDMHNRPDANEFPLNGSLPASGANGMDLGSQTTNQSQASMPVDMELDLTDPIFIMNSSFHSEQVMNNPASWTLASVLSVYMRTAILRETDATGRKKSLLSMTVTSPTVFQQHNVLSMHIHADKVQHIAMQLFRTHVERTPTGFCIHIEKGAVVQIGECTITGASIEAIESLLGKYVLCGVLTSPVRKIELSWCGQDIKRELN
jgi:hypothetical protein